MAMALFFLQAFKKCGLNSECFTSVAESGDSSASCRCKPGFHHDGDGDCRCKPGFFDIGDGRCRRDKNLPSQLPTEAPTQLPEKSISSPSKGRKVKLLSFCDEAFELPEDPKEASVFKAIRNLACRH